MLPISLFLRLRSCASTVEVVPSVERLDELVHPLLVERVRSSGVGLVVEVICDALIVDLHPSEGLGGFGALLHDDQKW